MSHGPPTGLLASQLRAGNPDFLDLPWQLPLDAWDGHCDRLEDLPRGQSRHPVVFVTYDGVAYALKGLGPGRAEHEYGLLRRMESLRLPAVRAIGHVRVATAEGETSVLITRYLDHSLPYHLLFMQSTLQRYREHLLDAMAGLLVRLHLAGVFWGDCSLFNTLFLRDAGTLQAYLVDAETSEIQPGVSERRRDHDLAIMEENVAGALLDLVAAGALEPDYPAFALAADVRRRYGELWREISRAIVLGPEERWRIEERVRALNALGFSVSEIELAPADGGSHFRLRVLVTDRNFHRDQLHSLTGLEVQEQQAQLMMNEVQQMRASLASSRDRSVPLSAAAHHWLKERYEPVLEKLTASGLRAEPAERYCQLLEHKWFLSERAQRDVGFDAALDDFEHRFAATPPEEPRAAVLGHTDEHALPAFAPRDDED